MRVFYDNQTFCMQKFGGISRYFYEIIKNASDERECILAKVHCNNVYASSLGITIGEPLGNLHFKGKGRLVKLFLGTQTQQNEACNAKVLIHDTFDIIHPTYYDPYFLPYKKGRRLVVTVHDMIHELFPQYFRKDDIAIAWKRATILAADRIIAISQNTKKDLLKLYPSLKAENIDVVYHATSTQVRKSVTSHSNYVLFTGNRWTYKNFTAFVQALSPLLKKYDLRLVCTGSAFSWQEAGLIEFLGIADRVDCRFASEEELATLYANALLFCFPSIYEGFGIPILEAFAAGTPVVCSNASCFPEVAGDAAVYFDPNDIVDMREKIESVISQGTLQNELVARGRKRLESFSWQKCAVETEATYRKALS